MRKTLAEIEKDIKDLTISKKNYLWTNFFLTLIKLHGQKWTGYVMSLSSDVMLMLSKAEFKALMATQ